MGKPDPRPDDQLIDAINDGDASAFESLYYRYRDWVVRLARRFVGNDDDALDVLQETFAYLHRKFPGFKLTARMTTFLYPVVKNTSLAVRRKRRLGMAGEEAMEAVPAPTVVPPGVGELAAVLTNLSDAHRETLLMRFVDQMSLDEIAEAIGIPVGTVKSRIHTALQTLRDDPRTREYL